MHNNDSTASEIPEVSDGHDADAREARSMADRVLDSSHAFEALPLQTRDEIARALVPFVRASHKLRRRAVERVADLEAAIERVFDERDRIADQLRDMLQPAVSGELVAARAENRELKQKLAQAELKLTATRARAARAIQIAEESIK